MAKLNIRQQQTQARSNGIVQGDPMKTANTAARMFDGATAILEKQRDDDDALQAGRLISNARMEWIERSENAKQSAELGAPNFSKNLIGDFNAYMGETLQGISNPRVQKIVDSKLNVDFRESLFRDAKQFETKQITEKRRLDFDDVVKNNSNAIIADPDQYGYLMDETTAVGAASGLMPIEREKAVRAARERLTETYIESLPPREQLSILNSSGGFKRAMDLVEKNEGGFVASDGASGAPALYGINRKWWPDDFDEAARITQMEGEAAGKAYARDFYKKNFWEKNKIGDLGPLQQKVVFDGVINHSADFSKKLVTAARAGATPAELLDMRYEEYQRLGKSDKHKDSLGGWMSRLKRVKSQVEVNGNLSPEFIKSQKKLATDAMVEVQDREKVALALEGKGFLDTSDSKQRKVYDDYYRDTLLPMTENMEGYERNAFLAGQIRNVGVAPPSLKAEISGKVRNGSDEDVIEAADLYLQIKENAPNAIADFNEKDLMVVTQVSEAIASGVPPQDAVAAARANMEVENKPLFDFHRKQMKDEDFQANITREAEGFFNTFIPFEGQRVDLNTQVGSALAADYKRAYEQSYLQSGNEKAAKRYAEQIISGRYSMSQFNDGAVMKYAPERYYSTGEDQDWMMEDFRTWRKANYPSFDADDADKYFIQADTQTTREASTGKPTYRVIRLDDRTAIYEPLEKRWSPDVSNASKLDDAITAREGGKAKRAEKKAAREMMRMIGTAKTGQF